MLGLEYIEICECLVLFVLLDVWELHVCMYFPLSLCFAWRFGFTYLKVVLFCCGLLVNQLSFVNKIDVFKYYHLMKS